MNMCFLPLFGLTGCGDRPPDEASLKSPLVRNRATVDIAVDGSTDAIGPAREAFLKKLKMRLKSIDEKIAVLADQESDQTEEAGPKRNMEVEELMIRRDAARRTLKTLNQASELGWRELRDEAEAVWQDLEKAVDAAIVEYER